MANSHKIRQLTSLVRLRQLQHDKSAKLLAIANMELLEAKENMLVAQARYQLVLEMQRKFRQTGIPIDPLYYGNHLEAADSAKQYLDESITEWQVAQNNKSDQLNEFSLHYCQLDVARNAEGAAKIEYQKKCEQALLDDCYDQQSKMNNQQMEIA